MGRKTQIRSSPRKRGPRATDRVPWIPACAGMNGIGRRSFMLTLAAAAAWPLAARAQQAEQTRRVGVLMPFDAQDSFGREIVAALREGLNERGWAEGRNVRISRVGFMVNPEVSPHYQNYFSVFTNVAPKFKVEPIRSFANRPSEVEAQIEALARQGGGGLLVAADTFTALNRQLIAATAARYRIPAVYVFREAVLAGGLISYGPEQLDVIRRSASYVDRILRGERPAELPIQAPVKFELVINTKSAQALGLEIPPTLLARADEVIE